MSTSAFSSCLVRTFQGPSVFCRRTALHLSFLLPPDQRHVAAEQLEGLRAALALRGVSLTTGLAAADASVPAGAVIADLTMGLQCWIGHAVSHRALLPARDPARDDVVVEYRIAEVGVSAARAAAEIVAAALPAAGDTAAALATRIGALVMAFHQRHAHDRLPGFIAVAEARGIPWRRPMARYSFYELGHGCAQRRLWRHFTAATSHLGTVIATHKNMASALFRANGLPAPHNIVVTDADAAVRAAHALGLPVVIKPASTDFGTAVNVNLRDERAIRRAFASARKHGTVLVEQMIAGGHHRLLVMYGQFMAAVRQTPAQVLGNGTHTIRALIEAANRTRADFHSDKRWKKIAIDDETEKVLHDQGLGLADVVAAGDVVRLRHQSNLSVGGTMENVTAQVHPDNQELAVRAARIAGLDVAGIDFITPDISRSHHEVGGAICEINPTPGFTMGEAPERMDEAFINGLFPPGHDGRLPTVVVLADAGAVVGEGANDGDLVPAIEALLAQRRCAVGVATATCVRIGAQRLLVGGRAAIDGAAIVLADPSVGAVLLALSPDVIVEHGLAFDRCTAAVIADGTAATWRGLDAGQQQRREAAVRLLASVANIVIIDALDPALGAIEPDAQLRLIDARVSPLAAPATAESARSALFLAAVADALGPLRESVDELLA